MSAAASDGALRVLVIAHAHPRISNGGAEIAAYQLYRQLAARPDVTAWFLGCSTAPGGGRDGVAITQPFTADEYLYDASGRFDWFRFANRDPRLPGELAGLLRELQPDIVHLHHYANIGVEAFLIIRRTLPEARIVVTLHEFQAICNHFGQMVKRGDFALCDRADLDSCHKCFPQIDRADFFMRREYVRVFFDLVDHFVCPSAFLAERYELWGIDRSRLSVIENIIAPAAALSSASLPSAGEDGPARALRMGFFGQISNLKGVGVLLECAALLAEKPDLQIVFHIHGDYRNQPAEFQETFLAQLARVTHNVKYHGAYRQDQVDRLMRGVDAVIVPSIWWENSPVVIQEALRNGRPVICSDIGGMAEKVREGLDGYHFPVSNPLELSYLITRLHDDPALLAAVRQTMRQPPLVADVIGMHLAMYRAMGGVAERPARVPALAV